jgi:olefin beta-lactone synthetase
VGLPFPDMDVRIIDIRFDAIADISEARVLPAGGMGEIIVRGRVATREYFRNPAGTAAAKIRDRNSFWHRMGDVGYLDSLGRLWICGRKAHLVFADHGTMHSVCCEEIINSHSRVYRCALVGIGVRGSQLPVLIVEPEPGQFPSSKAAAEAFAQEILTLAATRPITAPIRHVLFHPSLPVDTRHNTKINREQLAVWAADRCKRQ